MAGLPSGLPVDDAFDEDVFKDVQNNVKLLIKPNVSVEQKVSAQTSATQCCAVTRAPLHRWRRSKRGS
jgi:hypothetical protein